MASCPPRTPRCPPSATRAPGPRGRAGCSEDHEVCRIGGVGTLGDHRGARRRRGAGVTDDRPEARGEEVRSRPAPVDRERARHRAEPAARAARHARRRSALAAKQQRGVDATYRRRERSSAWNTIVERRFCLPRMQERGGSQSGARGPLVLVKANVAAAQQARSLSHGCGCRALPGLSYYARHLLSGRMVHSWTTPHYLFR